MSLSTLNIAVIGAGRIGKLHAENIATRVRGARLAGVADIDLSAAQQLVGQLRVGSASAEYQRMLDDPAVNVVAICSATNTHADIIEKAATKGKHIFCEKAVDLDLSRIHHALGAGHKAGVKCQVGFNRRFDPSFAKVREIVVSGGIGIPHLLRVTSRDPAPPPISYVKVSGG